MATQTQAPLTAVSVSFRRPLTASEQIDAPRRLTGLAALLVVLLVGLLLGFIGWNGIQIFTHSGYGLGDLLSPNWSISSTPPQYGILPFLIGTIGVMVVAALISAPLSIGLAIFMAEVAPAWARNITRPAMEVFVGIPSVVYGFLGLTILVPFLRTYFRAAGFTLGFSWLAGSLVLALMILPTITAIAYDAFISIPGDMRSASLALGTTRWQTIRHMLIPTARVALLTAIILGMMRAAGEALAVQMVIGNRPIIPTSLTQPMTTLTSQITLDMGNTVAGEPANEALWTMGLVLLFISFGFVLLVRRMGRKAALT
jgi:phosphate transport system permease protein